MAVLAVSAGSIAYVYSFGQFIVFNRNIQSHFSTIDLITNIGPLVPKIIRAGPLILVSLVIILWLQKYAISLKRFARFDSAVFCITVLLFFASIITFLVPYTEYQLRRISFGVISIAAIIATFSMIAERLWQPGRQRKADYKFVFNVLVGIAIANGLSAVYTAGICDVLIKISKHEKSNTYLLDANKPRKITVIFAGSSEILLYDGAKIFFLKSDDLSKIFFLPPPQRAIDAIGMTPVQSLQSVWR